jgi:hypothetical protein
MRCFTAAKIRVLPEYKSSLTRQIFCSVPTSNHDFPHNRYFSYFCNDDGSPYGTDVQAGLTDPCTLYFLGAVFGSICKTSACFQHIL